MKAGDEVVTERNGRTYHFADFEVDERELRVVRGDQAIPVEPKAFRVLLFFLQHPNRLITKDELLNAVWPDTTVSENSLTRSIALLRRQLGDDTHEPRYIATVPTVGYRFLCEVKVVEEVREQFHPEDSNPIAGRQANEHLVQAGGGGRGRKARWIFAAACLVLVLPATFLLYGTFGRHGYSLVRNVTNARYVPLTTVSGNVWDPAFSPDGKAIAFLWDGENPAKGDLYVQLVGAERPLRLSHTRSGYVCCADWSPDGQQIAFGRCWDNGGAIYAVPALGGVERKLTDVACPIGEAGHAKWTADGMSLVITDSCVPGGPPGVVLLSIATGEKRCLTGPPRYADPGDSDISLSPDHRTIAFFRGLTLGYRELYTVELSGRNLRQLTHSGKDIWGPLIWTKDGRYIVFGSGWYGGVRPSRISVEGGAIEPDNVYPRVGALSPDHQRLAYVESSELPSETWRAELAAPAGKVLSLTKLVSSSGDSGDTQFSPDERQIVFRSIRTGTFDIWKSNADGSDPQRLTFYGDKGWPGTPRWSSDGNWIAFDSRLGKHSHITLVDTAGRNQHDVVADDYENAVPSWSRDGRFLYFVSNRTGKWQVWRLELATGQETQVTRNGGFAAFESYDGKTLYYSRFEGGGLWSMPTGGGAEEHITDALHRGYWGHFAVTEAGIYLLDADAVPRPTILYYSFHTRQLTPVLQLEEHPLPWGAELAASRDGKTLLITQEVKQSTIMMAENFP